MTKLYSSGLMATILLSTANSSSYSAPIEFTDSGQSLGISSGFSIGASLGDRDGDCDIDAFVTRVFGTNDIEIWRNNGTGTFELSGTYASGEFRNEPTLGDFDQDGDLDAFVTDNVDRELWVNNGSGVFTLHKRFFINVFSGVGAVTKLTVADLDNDSDLDIFIGGLATEVILNQGGILSQVSHSVPGISSWHALGDVDVDGDLDAYLACNCADTEKLLLNDGFGQFSDSGQVFPNAGDTASFGNFDAIEGLDVIVSSSSGLKLLTNNGSGVLTQSSVDSSIGSRFDMVVADLDSDGDLDAFLTSGNDRFEVLNNNRAGVFESDEEEDLGRTATAALADLDGDGDLDAYLTLFGASDQVWFNASSVALPDTDGDGIADQADNCPTLPNSDQLDTDSDQEGNVCDDGDGVIDVLDDFPLDPTRPAQVDTTCPAQMPLGNLGLGVAALDNASGVGWMMWSSVDVRTRFTPAPISSNARHLIVVRYESNQWFYDNNATLTPFTPAANDYLLAELDFDNSVVTPLQDTDTQINGIDSGYLAGDLVITPNTFAGSPNQGECYVEGTQVGDF